MSWYKPADVGFAARAQLLGLGQGARLFARLLALLPATLKRPGFMCRLPLIPTGSQTAEPTNEVHLKNEPDKIIYSMIRVSKRHGQKEVLKDISLSYF